MLRKIDLIYIDSGGGHRAAANALAAVVKEQKRPWDLRMFCIQDLFNSIDFIRKYTGIPFQDVYNIMLRRGWTFGSAQLIPVMHAIIRLFHRRQVRILEGHWEKSRPDMVVSLIPHYNRAMKESLERVCPGTPYVTILTDIADYPPHFWIEPQNQYVVCGSGRAVRQARDLGLAEWQILPTSGMILHPRFHEQPAVDRCAERIRLGLEPGLPTGLVLFGGEGSMEMVQIALALNQPHLAIQLILICGRHKQAAEAIRALPRHIPMVVEGFTRDIPHYMELADFFIGKPGPGSISEALAKGLPVIVQCNMRTLAHERYNARWIEERGVGIVVKSFAGIADAVGRLLEPERFAQLRRHVDATRNFAVYEIPSLLERILPDHSPAPEASPAQNWAPGMCAPFEAI